MQYSKFSFELTNTNPSAALGFEAWLDDTCVFSTNHVEEKSVVTGYLPDDAQETQHCLKFVLKNKQAEHTQINDRGEIVTDACVEIANLTFDDIELEQMVNNLAVYQHDCNGTDQLKQYKFYGTMGCNGTVELKFTTPIYLWLLENM